MATDLKGLESFKNKLQRYSNINASFTNQVAEEVSKRGEQIAREEYVPSIEIEEYEEFENETIVRKKEVFLKPIDEEEAIVQMELLGHDFFVFKRAKDETVCVLYKRKDNNYGIIETN